MINLLHESRLYILKATDGIVSSWRAKPFYVIKLTTRTPDLIASRLLFISLPLFRTRNSEEDEDKLSELFTYCV